MFEALQIVPAFVVSNHTGWISCLHKEQVHEEACHTPIAVIEGVNAHEAIMEKPCTFHRMEILTPMARQP